MWMVLLTLLLVVPEKGAQAADSPGIAEVEIDRIDFSGVTVLPGAAVESTLEIQPGDRLSRLKVLRTEENLQHLYRSRGYEQAQIRIRLLRKKGTGSALETVLEFAVNEGKPVRVASLAVVSAKNDDPHLLEVFRAKHDKMRAAFPIRSGDTLDQEKILEGRRAVQELLASYELVGGKVVDIKVSNALPSAIPSSPDGVKRDEPLRWVSVEVQVDLGERVIFGFRGNSQFTQGFLNTLVSDLMLVGAGKDYVNTIKYRIEEEYRSIGFPNAVVTPYFFENPGKERRVSFVIREGTRIKIRSLKFDGNSTFSSAELRSIFFEKGSGQLQHHYYVASDIQKAGEVIVQHMKEKGYLGARLITISASDAPKEKGEFEVSAKNLVIYLYEGDRTVVRNVRFEGVTAYPDAELLRLLGLRNDEPLNLYALSDGLEALKQAYRNAGYLDVKILNEGTPDLVTYALENRVADIRIQVEEGSQIHVGAIEIEGLDRTNENVVRRELRITEGQVLGQPVLDEMERSMRRLGIFANVSIRTFEDPNRAGFRTIRLILKEADRGVLSYGPGYRYDLGIRAFGQLAYTNLWGLNHSISLSGAANRRFDLYNFAEGQVQLAYSWPWFLIPKMTFRPVITGGKTQFINFSANTLTASVNWDRQILSRPNLMGYFGYTFESVEQFAARNPSDNRKMVLGSITPKLSLDLRDNPLSPHSGFYSIAWVDLSYPVLGSQAIPFPIGYYRIQFRGDYYVPITKDITWYVSFRTGYEQSEAHTRSPNDPNTDPNRDAIPLIKQFTMGGVGSLRGFREQELNFQTRNILGSLAYVNYRTQLDLPFAGALKFALFLDAANLTQDIYTLGALRYGTGAGFHYETPVGPVSFDLGFKLDPRPGEDPYVVHFSVGVI